MRRFIRTLGRSILASRPSAGGVLRSAVNAASEELERRLLLSYTNVLVNNPAGDPGPWFGNGQNESTTIAFRPSAGGQPIVVTAYNDRKFFENIPGAAYQGTGWARSTDGGRTPFTDQGTFPAPAQGDGALFESDPDPKHGRHDLLLRDRL